MPSLKLYSILTLVVHNASAISQVNMWRFVIQRAKWPVVTWLPRDWIGIWTQGDLKCRLYQLFVLFCLAFNSVTKSHSQRSEMLPFNQRTGKGGAWEAEHSPFFSCFFFVFVFCCKGLNPGCSAHCRSSLPLSYLPAPSILFTHDINLYPKDKKTEHTNK